MAIDARFRFSPRANRAHDITWHEWGADAFERARVQNKPVLLSISAVWCHWCHVMDETTYSDPHVISCINDRYIPVRVESDRRPDVNARYNMGGWPTTAVLNSDGDTITGATYIPPDQMLRFLEDVAAFYREHRDEVAQKSAEIRARMEAARLQAGPLAASIITETTAAIAAGYDEEHGGFGSGPKFPQTDALEFLLRETRVARVHGSDDPRLYDMLARTALGMSRGGMYDHVEGGFFRYSTTRDWSIPHFEKMSEDHGGLLRTYAGLFAISRNGAFRETLVSATHFVRTVLHDPQAGLFAGSQDADEEYFALPAAERARREPPFVDRTTYVNWASNLASGVLAAAAVLGDDDLGGLAIRSLDAIVERALVDGDGLVRHYIETSGAAHVRGLLSDQVWLLRALLDAHEFDGEPRHRETAVRIADAVLVRFAAEGGAFVDNALAAQGIGRTQIREQPLIENGHLADALLRLSAIVDDERYAHAARAALESFATTYRRAGSFAAAYAGAVRRAIVPATVTTLIGEPAALADFRAAAARLPDTLGIVRSFAPGDPRLAAAAFPGDGPRAYVCAAQRCSAPVTHASDVRAAYESVRVPAIAT